MLIQTDLCSFLEKLKKYNRQPAGVNEKKRAHSLANEIICIYDSRINFKKIKLR